MTAEFTNSIRARKRAAIVWFGKRCRPLTNAIIGRYSLIGSPPVFDPAMFPWIAPCEADWRVIRDEAAAMLVFREHLPLLNEISPDHKRLAGDGKWWSFFLYNYGFRVDSNCERCPRTTALLRDVPGLETAMFSILAPGKHIPPHRGPTRAIFTWHLGLFVPDSDRCYIRVDDRRYYWQEGRSLVFDDTYEHEVVNETPGERVVLLVHIRRPVAFPGSVVQNVFLAAIKRSPFVQDALRNHRQWEKDFDAVTRRPR